MRKSLIIGLLSMLVLAGCGGSGGGSDTDSGGIPADRTVDLQVLVTNRVGDVVQAFREDDVEVTAATENATIASHLAALITNNMGQMPQNATLIVSDQADLNISNYQELAAHPEYIRYPRLVGALPFDDPLTVIADGELQSMFLFGDLFELQPALQRIMQYLSSEVLVPSGDVNRIGLGRAQAVTVFVRGDTL